MLVYGDHQIETGGNTENIKRFRKTTGRSKSICAKELPSGGGGGIRESANDLRFRCNSMSPLKIRKIPAIQIFTVSAMIPDTIRALATWNWRSYAIPGNRIREI